MADKAERNPIAKALKTLEWLVETPASGVGVREMAEGLNISPSSAHRLLSALTAEGFVRQDPTTSHYAIGPELLRWSSLINAKLPIRSVAASHIRDLVDTCNESAVLGIYDHARQQMMFASAFESSHPLRYSLELNRWMPVHTGASGLAIMAFLSDAEINSIIQRTRLAPATPESITDRFRLEAELKRVREQGFAFSKGQRIVGAVGLAAPVFGAGGQVLGDVALTIPEQRFDPSLQDRMVSALRQCAERISVEAGGRPTG